MEIKDTKKDKLEQEDFQRVHQFYKSYIAQGVPITQIGAIYNEVHNKNHAESTLRNRYEAIEKGYLSTLEAEEIVNKLAKADKKLLNADIKFREVTRLTQYVEAMKREIGDFNTVKNIILDGIYDEYSSENGLYTFSGEVDEEEPVRLYILSDAHAGYKYGDTYNDDIFRGRMLQAFNFIHNDIRKNKYKKVHIMDLGDQIEGTALRKGQLAQVTQLMVGQANMYIETFLGGIRTLEKFNPDVKFNLSIITRDNHSEVRVHSTQRNELDDSMAELIGASITREIKTAQRYGGMKNFEIVTGPDLIIELENGKNVAIAHGHLHTKNITDIHKQVLETKGILPDVVIVGHWHRLQSVTRNVVNGFMGKTITAPSIVGDTDYSEILKLSAIPGILAVSVYDTHADETFIPLD